jgi:hypothetical protein
VRLARAYRDVLGLEMALPESSPEREHREPDLELNREAALR